MASLQDTHGTYASYNNRGCRCDLCVAAEATYREELEIRRELGLVRPRRKKTPAGQPIEQCRCPHCGHHAALRREATERWGPFATALEMQAAVARLEAEK